MGVKDWGVTGTVEYMAGRLTQARNENHVQAKSCARAKTRKNIEIIHILKTYIKSTFCIYVK